MRKFCTIFSGAFLGCLLPVGAQVAETRTETTVTETAGGVVKETRTTTTTFEPAVRTQVVEYFEPYREAPNGLPPAWAARMKLEETPTAWRAPIAPGLVLPPEHRPMLVEPPPELVRVLPPPTAGLRYYVAGSNIVAVNPSYQVVDAVPIPTVTYKVKKKDDDDDDDNDDD